MQIFVKNLSGMVYISLYGNASNGKNYPVDILW